MRRLTGVIAAVALLSACAQRPLTTQEKGAVTGAALGAGTGAIIGSGWRFLSTPTPKGRPADPPSC